MTDINKTKCYLTTDLPALIFLTAAAMCAMLFFSDSTTPLGNNLFKYFDQSIFCLIGRNWAEGNVPYITEWDTKGPLVFFFNMLGYKLCSNSSHGVFCIQALNFCATVTAGYYLLRHSLGRKRTVFFLLVYVAAWCTVSSGGNQSGEWCMLPATTAFLLAGKYTTRADIHHYKYHPAAYSFFYGIFGGACLLTRASDFFPMTIFVFCIAAAIALRGSMRSLLANAAAFLSGFFIITLPFAVYFYINNAFDELVYTLFKYNFEYMCNSDISELYSHIKPAYFFIWFSSLFAAAMLGMAALTEKAQRITGVIWTAVSISTLTWLLFSFGNANYAVSWLSLLLLTPLCAAAFRQKGFARKCRTITIIETALVAVGFINYLRVLPQQKTSNNGRESLCEAAIARKIPHATSFVAYNCSPAVYVLTGHKPAYRYCFGSQDWAIECGPSVKADIMNTFAEGQASMILIRDFEKSYIRGILLKRYKLILNDRKNNIKLFKLK